jgi:release factor glutamine methyltransferase
LRSGGWLVLEIGHRQGDAVRSMLGDAGLRDVEIRRDLAGRERVAVARR